MASPASATRTSGRLVPVGAVVPASATASVGGSVGLLVSAAGTVGTKTSESSSSGSVWSESIVGQVLERLGELVGADGDRRLGR